ncbi:hypothetical protein [Elizabethkingia miricola]|uniref:hypothetical protein n=1 Tax=Elizabethkingia miricola TaxID=172045 RepID=UPI00099A8C22|nr:hypothetical protein [Elizabethkingia miricola]OPC10028.1 hypothetical protein BAY01_13840 [Elizabethkingia miricola]
MKVLLITLMVIITSCFYFPFEFTFLPAGINTKIMLAVIGVPLMGYHMIQMQSVKLSKEVLISSIIAILFSLIGFYSVDYNHSDDYSYATYIVSMWIWFLASYAAITLISFVHGYLSYSLIVNYLIAVCIMQCGLALAINFIPSFKGLVDAYFVTGSIDFLDKVKRLYGIGATLDVAGVRFSAVLIMIAVLLAKDVVVRNNQKLAAVYFISFLLIAGIGNMISRTTSVGMLIGVIYLIYALNLLKANVSILNLQIWKIILLSMIFVFTIGAYFYNTNKEIYELFRFGFEGFFNWLEKGVWYTDSTNKLNTEMWIWPEASDTKTWLIGKAVFTEWHAVGTDIGYCRFVFYCGLTGLSMFIFFFIYLSYSMWNRFWKIRHLFLLLFILALINWVKVSTDIFLVYALFLSLSSPYLYERFYIESEENENSI